MLLLSVSCCLNFVVVHLDHSTSWPALSTPSHWRESVNFSLQYVEFHLLFQTFEFAPIICVSPWSHICHRLVEIFIQSKFVWDLDCLPQVLNPWLDQCLPLGPLIPICYSTRSIALPYSKRSIPHITNLWRISPLLQWPSTASDVPPFVLFLSTVDSTSPWHAFCCSPYL